MPTKTEIKHLLFAILILSLAFGYNDGQPRFEWQSWTTHFTGIVAAVLIGVFGYYYGQKLAAKRMGFEVEFRLWGIKKFSLQGEQSYPRDIDFLGKKIRVEAFPIGAVIAFLVMFLSNGRLYFPAVCSSQVIVSHTLRMGKGRFVHPTELEDGKIAVAGPLALFLLAVIFKVLNTGGVFTGFLTVFSLMTVFHLLPFPGLDGFKILIGSPLMYIFVSLFCLVGVILLYFASIAIAMAIGGIVALSAFGLFLYFKVYKA